MFSMVPGLLQVLAMTVNMEPALNMDVQIRDIILIIRLEIRLCHTSTRQISTLSTLLAIVMGKEKTKTLIE